MKENSNDKIRISHFATPNQRMDRSIQLQHHRERSHTSGPPEGFSLLLYEVD